MRSNIIFLVLILFTSAGIAQLSERSKHLQFNAQKIDSAERWNKLYEINKEARTIEDRFQYKLAEAAVLNAENKVKEAISVYYEAINLAIDLRNDSLRGWAFARLGNMYLRRDNLAKALNNINEALKFIPEHTNDSNYVSLRANKLLIFSFLDQFSSYKESIIWLLDAAGRQPSKTLEANIYNNIGNCFLDLNKPDTSIYYFRKSRDIREKINELKWIGQSYNNIGTAYYLMDDYKQALKYFQQGLIWRIKGKSNYSGIIESYVNIGKTYYKLQNISLADAYLTKAFNQADSVGNLPLKQRSAIVLKELNIARKDHKKAMEFQDVYYAVNDSLYSVKKKDELANLTLDFETDQKLKQDSLKRVQAEFEVKLEKEKQEAISKRTTIIITLLVLFLGVVAFFAYTFFKSNKEKQKQNELITIQHGQLKQKQTEINDSINYAKHIQNALLPSEHLFKENCKEYFIYFEPKDVVSGDFYWATSIRNENKDVFVYITADCTGHGVPGAFMSLISISFFNEILDEEKITDPAEILNTVRKNIIQTLSQKDSTHRQDGLDCLVCILDLKTKQLKYAGANSRFFVAHSDQEKGISEYTTDKMPVGKSPRENVPFTTQILDLKEKDIIYTFTDGYADQFGGPDNKKLKLKNVKRKLESIIQAPLAEQEKELRKFFNDWKGSNEQIDDVTFIGVKVQ
jgi:serine phosphatase RsbU (regulator of sigma subunit)/Tfp pilus assembly protein PilF